MNTYLQILEMYIYRLMILVFQMSPSIFHLNPDFSPESYLVISYQRNASGKLYANIF